LPLPFKEQGSGVGTDQGLIRYDLIEDRITQKYDSRHGLVGDIVTVVKVDPQGHVWVGTHGGGWPGSMEDDGRTLMIPDSGRSLRL